MQISPAGSTYMNPLLMSNLNSQVTAATAEAAEAAQEAMYGLSTAVGGAAEAIMNIASGELSNAVDIMA